MKKITILIILTALVAGFNFLNTASSKPSDHKFHSQEEIIAIKDHIRRAPIKLGEYFLPSSSCRGCHGYDSAGLSNIDENFLDVNLVDRWESSMMANSAKDPLWRAKVSQEIITNPAHSGELQNKCTSCHAPMGRYTSMYHGNQYYGVNDIDQDSLGLDGVACGSCHKISPNTGFTYSGDILYDTNHVEYGPFQNPSVGQMQLYEGFTPTYSTHMDNSKVCSSCHTLLTQTADLSGNLIGGEFVEQATYHEYLNSSYPSNSIKCQTCHMPQNNDGIIIANGFLGLTPRAPFNQHVFVGGNSLMLKLIKNNKDSLGIIVPDDKFDSTIVATINLLKHSTVNFNVQLESLTADTAFFKVKIENKAGHKFPSGYPSRRAVLQFVALDAVGDTVFQSGIFDTNYRVRGETPAYESHHNSINQSNVSQIYELVMGDVNSNFTSVLERAAVILKDNRIPPKGFTTTHPNYDTVKISSDAIADADFNKTNTVEGSGIDYVHYAIPLAGISGTLNIKAKLYYQSVPPKWLDEMFTLSSYPINRFKAMYQSADKTPVLVASDSINNALSTVNNKNIQSGRNAINVFPTASISGTVYVSSEVNELIRSIDIIDAQGKIINTVYNYQFNSEMKIQLPEVSGVYYLRINTNNRILYKKVVKV